LRSKGIYWILCLSPSGVFLDLERLERFLLGLHVSGKFSHYRVNLQSPFSPHWTVSFYRVTDKQIFNLSILTFIFERPKKGFEGRDLWSSAGCYGREFKGKQSICLFVSDSYSIEVLRKLGFVENSRGSLLYLFLFLCQQEDFNQETLGREIDWDRRSICCTVLSLSHKIIIMTSLAWRWQKTAGVDNLPNF